MAAVYWRELQTLDWKAETGADGRFLWEDAPREDIWINVYGNGFITVQNRVVPASEAETVIKLARTLRVTGTVVNVRTRKPIESFTLTPGIESQGGFHTDWDRSRSRRQHGGRYDVRFPQLAAEGHVVRIEAEGYALGISRRIADTEGEARINFELVPAAPLRK